MKISSTFFKRQDDETFALFSWNVNKLWRFPVKNHDLKCKQTLPNFTFKLFETSKAEDFQVLTRI